MKAMNMIMASSLRAMVFFNSVYHDTWHPSRAPGYGNNREILRIALGISAE
jgi:hypothetical protein